MSPHPLHRDIAVEQPYHQPSPSTANFSNVHMQDSTRSTNTGFFSAASNVDARDSNFSYIEGNQTNIHVAASNENACLDKLPRAMKAGYSSKPHRTCSDGTRKEVLEDIERWEADEMEKFVYWLRSIAGCGKSTIAQTFAERSSKNGRLGASFFCSRDVPDRRNLKLIFPTLAHDLADRFPGFKTALATIVHSNPNVEHDGLTFQLEKLLVRPLKESGISCTIVVDALDECEDKEPVSAFLSALAQYVDEIPTIKFFITGRPEDRIRYGFKALRTKELPLHDVESATVDSDIKLYVKTELGDIARRRRDCINGSWPSDKDIVMILERCDGLFIIASFIIRFVNYRHASPQDRLKRILDMPHSTIYEGKSGIDKMYHQILEASLIDVDEDDDEYFDQLHNVVGSIVLAFTPLSRASLTKMLKTTSERICSILSCLHSVLVVPECESDAIRMCHKSFADFVTDPIRCRDTRYHINAHAQHLKLGIRCLELMNTTLTKNICHLPRYSMNKDIKNLSARRTKYIGAPLAYACLSWAKHLWSSTFRTGDDIGNITHLVNDLLQKHFLSWLEVLSIEDNFQVAVYALHDVRLWLTDAKSPASSLFALINDCERFVLRFFDVMEQSAMHIYHSALPWSPTSSITRRLYENELTTEVRLLNAIDMTWPASVRAILTGDKIVQGIEFSHDGALIAVGGDQTLEIYDTMTGMRRVTVDEYGWPCVFSPDDSLIVSGSYGGAVRVLDLQTGTLARTFEGHTNGVYSVAFSPCGTMIASGSCDGAARVWSMSSGCCQWVLEGHSRDVVAVCWSARGDRVISGSEDSTVRVWETSTGTCSKILYDHIGPVTAVASSHASFLAASGYTVKVYDSQSCDVIHTISSDHRIHSVRFSIGGEQIAYTSDYTGHIWDLAKKLLVTSIDHDLGFAVFSPDGSCLASLSFMDYCVRIWRQSESGHQHKGSSDGEGSDMAESVFFSPDGQVVASLHDPCGFKLWDAMTGTCSFTSDDVVEDYDNMNGVVFSPNSAFVALQSDYGVWIFDIHTRTLVITFDITFDTTFGIDHDADSHDCSDSSCYESKVVFSPNSAFVALQSDYKVRIFDIHTRTLVKSFDMDHVADYIAVSSDCSRFVSLWDSCLTLRDLENGSYLARLDRTPPYEYSDELQFAFTLDGNSVFIDDHVNTHCWHIHPASSPGYNQFASLPMDFIPIPRECSHQGGSLPIPFYRYEENSEWVIDYDGKHMLWIPLDTRYHVIASTDTHGKKVAVGTGHGVCIYDFTDVSL